MHDKGAVSVYQLLLGSVFCLKRGGLWDSTAFLPLRDGKKSPDLRGTKVVLGTLG